MQGHGGISERGMVVVTPLARETTGSPEASFRILLSCTRGSTGLKNFFHRLNCTFKGLKSCDNDYFNYQLNEYFCKLFYYFIARKNCSNERV